MKNTTLCYITRGDQVLMLHRTKKKNDINQDKWLGIGGHFEPEESPEECLLREAREETGLTLTAWRCRGIVTFTTGNPEEGEYMYLFTADGVEGELKECDEGDLQWVDRGFLDQLPKWEGDQIFLDLLWQDEPFFLLKLCYEGSSLKKAILNGTVIREKQKTGRVAKLTRPCFMPWNQVFPAPSPERLPGLPECRAVPVYPWTG